MFVFSNQTPKFPRLSRSTFFIALFIVVSASFMRQVMDFTKAKIGDGGFVLLIGLILLFSVLSFLVFIIKSKLGLTKKIAFVSSLTIGLFLVWQIKIPQERIHILEYSFLGWFVCRDLIRDNKTIKGVFFAALFTVIVGVLDEVFQAVLPYRYFELRDILLNTLGGLWGIILYLLNHGYTQIKTRIYTDI